MIEKLIVIYLKSILYYHPESGDFVWLEQLAKNIKIGTQAGSSEAKGYIRIRINGKTYKTHVLAWFYMTGEWPKEQIDHDDNIKNHNWWSNLRECNNQENLCNRGKNKNNKSGYKGVYWSKNKQKWYAQITFNYKKKFLGYFNDILDAVQAYNEAALKHHGEFARLNEVMI